VRTHCVGNDVVHGENDRTLLLQSTEQVLLQARHQVLQMRQVGVDTPGQPVAAQRIAPDDRDPGRRPIGTESEQFRIAAG